MCVYVCACLRACVCVCSCVVCVCECVCVFAGACGLCVFRRGIVRLFVFVARLCVIVRVFVLACASVCLVVFVCVGV